MNADAAVLLCVWVFYVVRALKHDNVYGSYERRFENVHLDPDTQGGNRDATEIFSFFAVPKSIRV
jgi:hypothetical protein